MSAAQQPGMQFSTTVNGSCREAKGNFRCAPKYFQFLVMSTARQANGNSSIVTTPPLNDFYSFLITRKKRFPSARMCASSRQLVVKVFLLISFLFLLLIRVIDFMFMFHVVPNKVLHKNSCNELFSVCY